MTVQVFDQVAHARAMRASGYWRGQASDKYLACAVSQPPDEIAVIDYRDYRADRRDVVPFTESKVAEQYRPKRLEVVADPPRTPAGKVQKFKLRELLATGAARA